MKTRTTATASVMLAMAATTAQAVITVDPIKNDVAPVYNGTDDPWTIPGSLIVGNNFDGEGQLDVTAGSIVNSSGGTLGFAPGSEGTVTVTGSGSQWNNTGFLTISNFGTGTLSVLDGAAVSQASAVVGQRLGTTGTVTVDGAGSQWNAADTFFLGQAGGIAIVNVQAGGSMSGQSISVGDGSSLTLTGPGTTASSSVSFVSQETVEILNGATLTSIDEVEISGSALISGPGSQWTLDGAANSPLTGFPTQLKFSLQDATLTLEDGGKLVQATSAFPTTDTIFIAELAGSQSAVNITGSGSELSTVASLRVGDAGVGEMNIQAGGSATVDRSMNIATLAGSAGSSVTVTGPGSELSVGNALVVGREDAGELTIINRGLVKVDGTLVIDLDENGDSFINMDTGGQLALLGDIDDTLAQFLAGIAGTDAINYWDGSAFADITGATRDVDYSLEFQTTGDLAGYTVLTVPEPHAFALLAVGGLLAGLRRNVRRPRA